MITATASLQPVARALTMAYLVVGLSAIGFSQKSGKIPIHSVTKGNSAVIYSPSSDFPVISHSVRRPFRAPTNPSRSKSVQNGIPNDLFSGGIGNGTPINPAAKFPGIGFQGSYPADPQIAVSKTHIVQVTNTAIAFFDKKGATLYNKDIGPNGFFTGLNATDFCFDPKVFYDVAKNKFFVVCLEVDFNASTSWFLIAVSDNGNPFTSSWKKYRVPNLLTDNSNKFWLDYEGWGHNKDAVVATGNMFPFSAGGVVVTAHVFKKSELIAGTAPTVTSFIDRETFTIQVAKMDDTTSNFVFGTSLDTTSSVRVYAWRNFTTTPEMVYTTLAVPDFRFCGDAPSQGGSSHDSLSGRLVDATYRTGSLLTCHTTGDAAGKGQATWYEIKPGAWPTSGNPTLAQAGNVNLPGDAWAIIPGINKNAAGDISMVFTRSSSNIIGDVMSVGRKSSDPLGTMGNLVQLGTSKSPYLLADRWGDYVSTCVDPSDDHTFWGNHMYSESDGTWGTHIVSWSITKGGGGGGGGGGNGGTKSNAVGVATLEGTFVSGTLTSYKTFDSSTYDTNAIKKTDGSYATSVEGSFTSPYPRNNVADIEINLKAFIATNKAPVGYIFAWNWNKNKWDMLKSYNLSSVNTLYKVNTTTLSSNYVNSSTKKIRVMLRALDPVKKNGPSPGPFKLRTDGGVLFVLPKN